MTASSNHAADCAHCADPAHAHAHSHRTGPRRIYVYSPSAAVRDRAAFRRGIARLRALGHEVEVDTDTLARHTRFAGDDATRLAAIHRAAASGADIAIASRGGYGITRILPGVDWAALARAAERQGGPTRFVGYSDCTALQLGLLAERGAISWAGPDIEFDFGAAEPDDIMEACFDDLLLGQGEGTGWRLPATKKGAARAESKRLAADFVIENATLWGGNLSVLTALVGTRWMPQPERGILFLEDTNEHPFRIERMLTQLLHAGILGRQQAILLGAFDGIRLAPHDRGFKLASVVEWLQSQVACPVLTGLPFGHVPTKVLLPVGARVTLACEGRDALVAWGHL